LDMAMPYRVFAELVFIDIHDVVGLLF